MYVVQSNQIRHRSMTSTLNSRSQIALLRPPRERAPMSIHKRRVLESHSFVTSAVWGLFHSVRSCCRQDGGHRSSASKRAHRRFRSDLDVDSPCEDGDDSYHDRPQFTLKSVRRSSLSRCRRMLRCTKEATGQKSSHHYYTDAEPKRWDINSLISSYLSFSHRTSYFLLFLLFSLVYYANILVFAFVYWGFSAYYPECVTSAGVEIGSGENSDLFGDSFVLSWTTFSTVGYGSVYPSTGANSDEALPRKCMIVGVIGSFEAFVGVLYAGFCTAVLFGKVIRSQSQAQVYFSDPLVIRYGKQELLSDKTSNNLDVESQDVELGETLTSIEESRVIGQKKNDVNIPCPVLEFRLVNRLHDVEEGEIVEAQLDCVAIFDQSRIISTDSSFYSGECGINGLGTFPQSTNNGNTDNHPEAANVANDNVSNNSQPTAIFHSYNSKQNRAITKLTLESNEHPYFRRVWFGRHILDENSPLLSELARTKIKQNGGYWPAELNNHFSIRDNLHFRHVLVCFSGTSNANATSVYAQKVYDLINVNVGYRFVPMNYRAETGELKTDSYLLNAISEQRGGGAEPFL